MAYPMMIQTLERLKEFAGSTDDLKAIRDKIDEELEQLKAQSDTFGTLCLQLADVFSEDPQEKE